MGTIGWLFVIGIGTVVAFVVLNKVTHGRLLRFVLNKGTAFGQYVESKDDPAAGLQRVADDQKKRVAAANEGLVEGEALEADLEEKVTADSKELARLEAIILNLADKPNKTASDAQLQKDYESKYNDVEERLKFNQEALVAQTEDNAKFYEEVRQAADEIAKIEAKARQLGVMVRTADAREQFAKTRSKFDAGGLSAGRSEAERFEQLAKDKINKAKARSVVNEKLETAEERIARHEREQATSGVADRIRAKRAAAAGGSDAEPK